MGQLASIADALNAVLEVKLRVVEECDWSCRGSGGEAAPWGRLSGREDGCARNAE